MKGPKKISKKKRQKSEAKGQEATQRSAENGAKIIFKIRELIESLCEAEGLELVHIEYQREAGGRILRLFIDRPGGITLDDCVCINRQAGDLLDVYLENAGPYSLEVSSPGPHRPLSKALDYERFMGKQARIRTRQPIGGQRNFKGALAGISEGIVRLSVEGTIVSIPFGEIARAQLVEPQ
ncbi:MAG: ribosome maturation factor RimP [Pseudomonadota bacterium]